MHKYPLSLPWYEDPPQGFFPYQILQAKAELLWLLGRLMPAREIHERAVLFADASGRPSLSGDSRIKLSKILYSLGEVDTALTLAEQAGEFFLQAGDRLNLTGADIVIGIIHSGRGNYNAALKHLNSGLQNAVETNDLFNQGNIFNNLGNLYFYQGDLEKALEFYLKMKDISAEIDYKAGLGRALGNIASVYTRNGQYEEALDYSKQSLAIARELGDSIFIAQAVGNLGFIYTDLKKYDEALSCFHRQLAEAGKTGNLKDQAIALASIAEVHAALNNFTEAEKFYSLSLPIYRKLGRKYDLCGTLLDLAEACLVLKDPGRARELAVESLDMAREINKQDIIEKAEILLNKID